MAALRQRCGLGPVQSGEFHDLQWLPTAQPSPWRLRIDQDAFSQYDKTLILTGCAWLTGENQLGVDDVQWQHLGVAAYWQPPADWNRPAPPDTSPPPAAAAAQPSEEPMPANLHPYPFDELEVGQQASRTWTVDAAAIEAFAAVTGDHNRVHLDEEFAQSTPFKGRIAHGMLTAGYISAVLANQLPGPGTIYLSQDLRFRAPVRPGDQVTVTVTVRELVAEKRRVVLDTVARVADKVVAEGTATVLPPAPPA